MQFYKIIILTLFSMLAFQGWSQKWVKVENELDTVLFKASQILIKKDTILFSSADTFALLKRREKYKIRKNPYSKSATFYDSLQIKSYRNKVTKELYQLVFRSAPIEVQDTSNFNKSEEAHLQYQGLKIRSIRLKKVDIIEGSIHDTSIIAQSIIGRGANNIHVNTRDYVIYNNLSIKEGDLLDAIKLADNERILRTTPYIEDARILVVPDLSDSGLVDLLVIVKDRFSIGTGIDYSSITNFKLFVFDNNFLGIGHEIRPYLIYRSGYNPQYGYALRYNVNNISNSFISARFDYENSWDKEFLRLKLNKEFLTQQTKYAGGINLYKIVDTREYNNSDTITIVPYTTINQDYWIGRAFMIIKDKGITFNTSFRFSTANFLDRPLVTQDSNFFYQDQSLILSSFSLVKRKYYLSSMVYGFGLTEDIPYGYKLNFIFGYEKGQFYNKPYMGGALAFSKHFRFPGYIGFNIEYGSFFVENEPQDAVFKLKLLNIGNLHHLNRYSIRNFIDFNFQAGLNLTDRDSKTIVNDRWTSMVTGLEKEELKGNQKLSLNLESVLFTPWYLLGFKFSLVSFVDMAWVTKNVMFEKNTTFYASIGAGLQIKNESWVFETITLGFAYFASAPEGSSRIGFILNASDPRLFKNLNPGKPDIVRMDQSPLLFLD